MSSMDSNSYTSEVSNDSASSLDSQDTTSNQGVTKKSKNKRNKGKGKWRKKNDFNHLNTDTTNKILSRKEFQSSFEKIVDLLDYDGLISEIKAENETLVTFLSTPSTVQVLICLVIETVEFPAGMEVDSNKFKYKFPFVISEILSMECLSLASSGALNDDTLSLFFNFLRKPDKDLEPAAVNIFAKIASTFCQIYEETILDYVQRNSWILDSLLEKIHFYPLANFLLQLHLPPLPFTEGCDSSTESAQEMTIHCCYVNDYFLLHHLAEKFLPNSLSHLTETQRQETIHNAAFVFLGLALRTIPYREYIAIPPELDILCEISLLGSLLSYGLAEANNNLECLNDSWYSPVLMNALTIIYEILGSLVLGSKNDRWNADDRYSTAILLQFVQQGIWECSKDTERLVFEIEAEIVPKFGQLASLLSMNNDQEKNKLKQKPRLGGLRLKIAEFFLICLVTCSKDTIIEIFNFQVPQLLLTLFVECDMCNILQHQVAALLSFTLQKTDAELSICQKLWILECRLFSWFIDAWELNFISEQQHHIRKSYMGHLIPLGNTLATMLEEYENELFEIIDDDVLSSFERIRDHDLQIENEIQATEIGGSHPIYSNEERKSNKLQVDTLGVDFDQIMGGIISSDVATIHMFSEYLYEDDESPTEEDNQDDEDNDDEKIQMSQVENGNEDEALNIGSISKKIVTKSLGSSHSPESSLSSRFAQMLAMNASDIVPVSNRKLSLERNNKPHRESYEKLSEPKENTEKDIFEDDSFLWAVHDEEEVKESTAERDNKLISTKHNTSSKVRADNSKNFVKRRTFLSNHQLSNGSQSAMQQPSVILRDSQGHAIGTIHSSAHSNKKQETTIPIGSSHETTSSQDKKKPQDEKNNDETDEKDNAKLNQPIRTSESRIPQLLNQDLTTKAMLPQGKSSIVSNASKLYRRKKETDEVKTAQYKEPAWQKDHNDVFSTLVRNFMQNSFYRNHNQNSSSRKTN
ncbi:hypothetical protein Gasu2_62410 [Galdieria sulphuraria]|uniref:SIT4 phosphatase-associated family protein n=1 Tax=Galdieria sulphuraria TaxID=130081 RepID=M2XDM3_GALSU|nr:SIT4 phosphatase-associated family protein [Galdieria sulphuraria]EME28092.1 SIT4 phosphatase-associated family protein [Galdieria sulphuraria]GJD12129.1 hypothetical protein Gasu2_62410 [Galdieria sulphuraria]|eukprot:XP_005704612.1 SIT4 phosphatase-associated family protein [Galdieria sulphuraria]